MIAFVSLVVSLLAYRRSGRWLPSPWPTLTLAGDVGGQDGFGPKSILFHVSNIGDGPMLEVRAEGYRCSAHLLRATVEGFDPVDYADHVNEDDTLYVVVDPAEHLRGHAEDGLVLLHWYEPPARKRKCRLRAYPARDMRRSYDRLTERKTIRRLKARLVDHCLHRRYHRWSDECLLGVDGNNPPDNGVIVFPMGPFGPGHARRR